MGMNTIYKGRVRTGCLACRASKVKCDEQRPVCKRCTRQSKPCIYRASLARSHRVGNPSSLEHSTASAACPPFQPATIETLNLPGPLRSSSDTPTPRTIVKPHQARGQHDLGRLSPTTSLTTNRSPSLISTLISQDIYICTTIDLLAAKGTQPSLEYFRQHVDIPYITPYDPVNWSELKRHVVEWSLSSEVVAGAAGALQALHLARKNHLPHANALAEHATATQTFNHVASTADSLDRFEPVFTAAFLLLAGETLLPHEMPANTFMHDDSGLVSSLKRRFASTSIWSPLSVRLIAWSLVAHAAARRGGGGGLLSPQVHELFSTLIFRSASLSPIGSHHDSTSSIALFSALTDPFFDFFTRLQLISTQIANLSHYHRRRTTGDDQEEVAILMADLKDQIETLWQSRPVLMRLRPEQIRKELASSDASEPLLLLSTLCNLSYHTELVELGRNLAVESSATVEAKLHLSRIRTMIAAHSDPHPAFLRPLFLYAIESESDADCAWAISEMRKIKDPLCYSEFFANFAAGLTVMQRQKERRVTTKWFSLQTFGVPPPYL